MHRDTNTTLSGNLVGTVVTGVDVPNDTHAWVIGQNAGKLLTGKFRAIGYRHLASVDRASDANTTAMVDRNPGST